MAEKQKSEAVKSAAQPPLKKKRRLWRRLIAFAIISICVLLVLVLAIPSILSSGFGRGLIVSTANKQIPGKIGIESVEFAWFGGQRIEGFSLRDPDGNLVVEFQEFSTEGTLWGLSASGNFDVGETKLIGMKCDITVDELGVSNLDRAVGVAKEKPAKDASGKAATAPSSLAGAIRVVDAVLKVSAPGIDPVEVKDINCSVDFAAIDKPINIQISAKPEQGGLAGDVSVEGAISNAFDQNGVLQPDQAKADLNLKLHDTPIDGLDSMLKLQGVLSAALGKRLNLDAAIQTVGKQTQVNFGVKTENLTADFGAKMDGEALSLSRPGEATLMIDPALLEALIPKEQAAAAPRLFAGTKAKFVIDELYAPVGAFNPESIKISSRFTLADTRFGGVEGVGDVALRGFEASVKTSSLAKDLQLGLSGKIEQSGQSSAVNISASLRDWLDATGLPRFDTMQADAKAELTDVPVGLIDQIAGMSGLLTAALGPRLTASAELKGDANQKQAKLMVKSENLSATAPVSIGNDISLSAPAEVRFTASPKLLKQLAPKDSPFILDKPVSVTATVSRFSAPMPEVGATPAIDLSKIILDASIVSSDIAISGLPTVGAATISNLKAQVAGKSLSESDISFSTSIVPGTGGDLVRAAAGPKTEIQFSAHGGPAASGALNLQKAQFNVSAQNLKVSGEGRLGEALELTKPIEAALTLTQDLIKTLAPAQAGQIQLAKPAVIQVSVEPITIPLSGLALDQLLVSAKVNMAELALAKSSLMDAASLRNLSANLDFNGKSGSAKAKIGVQAAASGETADVQADVSIKNILTDGALSPNSAAIEADAQIEKFPIALADAFAGTKGLLPKLIGPSLTASLNAKIDVGGKAPGSATIKAASANLSADASLKAGENIALAAPALVKLTLTPEAFAALAAMPDLALAEPSQIEVRIDTLNWPMGQIPANAKAVPISRAAVAAAVSVPRIAILNKALGRTAALESMKASVASKGLGESVSFDLTSQLAMAAAKGGGPKSGAIKVSGEISDLFTEAGVLNTAGLTSKATANLTGLPVAELDGLANMDGLLLGLLGDTLDAQCDAEIQKMSGPVSVSVNAATAKANVVAALSPGAIGLGEPLTAELTMTPALSQAFLKNVNPLLVTAVGAENPVTLNVPREGVALPMAPPVLPGVSVPVVNVELGTIILENGGVLKGLLDLLKVNAGEKVNAVFTPLKARMAKGVASYEPMDVVIADQIRVRTWGTIDLAGDMVDMKMGITADTLERVAGLKGLGEDDLLIVPMRGPTANVKVDWSAAIKDLGKLAIKREIEEKVPDIGGLLDSAFGKKQDPKKAPESGSTKEVVPDIGSLLDAALGKKKQEPMKEPESVPAEETPGDGASQP